MITQTITIEDAQDSDDDANATIIDPEAVRDVGERLDALGQRALNAVQQHPLAAVVVALGAGFLIARLIRR